MSTSNSPVAAEPAPKSVVESPYKTFRPSDTEWYPRMFVGSLTFTGSDLYFYFTERGSKIQWTTSQLGIREDETILHSMLDLDGSPIHPRSDGCSPITEGMLSTLYFSQERFKDGAPVWTLPPTEAIKRKIKDPEILKRATKKLKSEVGDDCMNLDDWCLRRVRSDVEAGRLPTINAIQDAIRQHFGCDFCPEDIISLNKYSSLLPNVPPLKTPMGLCLLLTKTNVLWKMPQNERNLLQQGIADTENQFNLSWNIWKNREAPESPGSSSSTTNDKQKPLCAGRARHTMLYSEQDIARFLETANAVTFGAPRATWNPFSRMWDLAPGFAQLLDLEDYFAFYQGVLPREEERRRERVVVISDSSVGSPSSSRQ